VHRVERNAAISTFCVSVCTSITSLMYYFILLPIR
jgi:hypothetical protein